MATTGALFGSGTPSTTGTTWSNVTSAAGTNNATFAEWTTTASSVDGTIDVSGYGIQAAIGATPSAVGNVSVTVYAYVSNTARIGPASTVQLTDGGVPFGTPQTLTRSTTTTTSATYIFSSVTWAQLANLGVLVKFSRGGTSLTSTGFVDAVSVDVTYTPGSGLTGAGAVTAPAATAAGAGTSTATGAGAVTAPPATGSGAGTSTVTGSGAVTAPAATGAGLGTSDDTTFAAGSVTAPAATGSGSGTSTLTGAGSVTAPPSTGSGAGTSTVTGAGAVTAPASTGSGAGTAGDGSITGSGAVTAPAATAEGNGANLAERCVVTVTHTPVGVLSVVPLVPSTELDTAVPITRTSVLAPALSAEYPAHPEQGAEGAPDVVRDEVGYLHLWIGGQDVTYWRGGMTVIRSWESQAPFGDTVAAFEFPQRNPWDVDGEGDLSFLRPDAPVVIGIVKDGVTRQVWRGFLDAAGSGLGEGEDYTYEAKGTFWQAQSRIREPHSIVEPVDIGVWIARVLNASEGRHWRTMPLTPIGITTMTRGARDEYDMEYVQALLTEAVTDDLRQWTLSEVLPGVPRLVLKPAPSTVHATVAYGTPGVDVDLRVDQSTRWDRVFLRGIGPKMGGWANIFYPHLELLRAPAYPMAGFANIDLGTTDADTTSGTGVTDWQRRVDEIRGFANPAVSGVMSSAWVAVIDDLQRRVGVTADGSLGPQTWNATFDRGRPDPEALTPRRLPMASKPSANKWLYNAAGVRLGPNPLFDRSLIVRDGAVDVGPGKTKADGFKLARKWLARYGTAAANGTITFTFDPNETDRTTISHLSNIKVVGFQGGDRVLQVASKSVELEGNPTSGEGPSYVVTCRVDERARDAMAVEDLLEQRRSAMPDPSRNPVNRNRASRAVSDQRIPWDSESPCGVLRRTAVNGSSGLWTVVTVPFAEVGKLAGIRLTSDRPFALAILASLRITENKLASIIGNPFTEPDKWRDVKDLLDDYGVIEAWGAKDQACGYSPKTETAIPPGTAGPFTGRFEVDTPVDYWTETPPYVSVAIFMRGGSGWISGEFLPAYEP